MVLFAKVICLGYGQIFYSFVYSFAVLIVLLFFMYGGDMNSIALTSLHVFIVNKFFKC